MAGLGLNMNTLVSNINRCGKKDFFSKSATKHMLPVRHHNTMTKKQIRNIILAIVLGTFLIYQIIDSIDFIKERENNKKEWTEERIRTERHRSELDVYNQSPEYKYFPEIVAKFCDCTIDTIIQHYNFQEYRQISKIPYKQQIPIVEPVLKKCIDSLISRLNKSPIWDSIRMSKNIKSCAEKAFESGQGEIDSIQAYAYCNCFLGYLKSKYGKVGTFNMDSVLPFENEKRKECLESVIK